MSETEFNTLCEHSVTTMWQELVLGHALLLEKLLADSKLSKGARVVFAGAEAIRNVPLMIGLQPHISFSKAVIATWPTKQWNSWLRIRAILGAYGTAKRAGSLFLSTVARERPNLYMVTVSLAAWQPHFLMTLGRCALWRATSSPRWAPSVAFIPSSGRQALSGCNHFGRCLSRKVFIGFRARLATQLPAPWRLLAFDGSEALLRGLGRRRARGRNCSSGSRRSWRTKRSLLINTRNRHDHPALGKFLMHRLARAA